jgi:hypothetical protein
MNGPVGGKGSGRNDPAAERNFVSARRAEQRRCGKPVHGWRSDLTGESSGVKKLARGRIPNGDLAARTEHSASMPGDVNHSGVESGGRMAVVVLMTNGLNHPSVFPPIREHLTVLRS